MGGVSIISGTLTIVSETISDLNNPLNYGQNQYILIIGVNLSHYLGGM